MRLDSRMTEGFVRLDSRMTEGLTRLERKLDQMIDAHVAAEGNHSTPLTSLEASSLTFCRFRDSIQPCRKHSEPGLRRSPRRQLLNKAFDCRR